MATKDLDAALGGRVGYRSSSSGRKTSYYRLLSQTLERIHSRIPTPEDSTLVPPSPDEREEYFDGASRRRLVIYLLSQGCDWAIKKAHGCTMCGHLAKQTRQLEIPAGDQQRQFFSVFNRTDWSRYPILNLYNNGSFLNDAEIPADERYAIVRAIGANPHIRMVVFESRPEFVNEDNVRELREWLPGKHVEIAIGLETVDDHRRAVCVNKGFSLRQYNRAAAIVTKHLKLRTYVLLKPPFFSEAEAVEDAVMTIRHAFAVGSTTVSLEPCTIQAYTLVEYLSTCGLYQPPWLWTIVEVLHRTAGLGKLSVGMFQFYPAPNLVPHNCEVCNDRVLEQLRQYNRTLDLGVFEASTCECRSAWYAEMGRAVPPFEERVVEAVRQMNNLLDQSGVE